MLRRIHHAHLSSGRLVLGSAQAHHVRDVLRLDVGDKLELFDNAGAAAEALIEQVSPTQVWVYVEHLHPAQPGSFHWTVASAIPKAQRADWMIEKLSELGTDRFIPLAAARSIVLPEGKNKLERWRRLAAESAKQSRRRGVMRIENLSALEAVFAEMAQDGAAGWYLSTGAEARPIGGLLTEIVASSLVLFVGPEGGWTNEEINAFCQAGIEAVSLTSTILRVETAAIAAAAIVGCTRARPRP